MVANDIAVLRPMQAGWLIRHHQALLRRKWQKGESSHLIQMPAFYTNIRRQRQCMAAGEACLIGWQKLRQDGLLDGSLQSGIRDRPCPLIAVDSCKICVYSHNTLLDQHLHKPGIHHLHIALAA